MAAERTLIDHYIRATENSIKFTTEKLESDLKWIESAMSTIRENIAKGRVSDTSLVAYAADAARTLATIQGSMATLEALKEIKETP